jgi:hypothetical protein
MRAVFPQDAARRAFSNRSAPRRRRALAIFPAQDRDRGGRARRCTEKKDLKVGFIDHLRHADHHGASRFYSKHGLNVR